MVRARKVGSSWWVSRASSATVANTLCRSGTLSVGRFASSHSRCQASTSRSRMVSFTGNQANQVRSQYSGLLMRKHNAHDTDSLAKFCSGRSQADRCDARYTFFLPSEIEIAAVVVGGLVKLMFEYPHQKETWAAERMWVEVKRIDDGALLGSLGNVPDEPTSPLQKGDLVSFKSSDILAISWTNPASAPRPPEYREYWERCLLDECVLEGGQAVEFIYREEPDMAQ
jgi:Uncharacterized protein conserved in bacteria (DUF2314)